MSHVFISCGQGSGDRCSANYFQWLYFGGVIEMIQGRPLHISRPSLQVICLLLICSGVGITQELTEVVAPVGRRTLVDIVASHAGAISVQKNSFDGTTDLITDPHSGRSTVVIVPAATAGPAQISIVDASNKVLQMVRVFPVKLTPEVWALPSTGSAIDPSSLEYVAVTQGTRPNQGIFNGQNRTSVRTIQISGYHLDIQPGLPQGIYETLMPNGEPVQDLGLVEIFAKEVVIAAPLRLPGATVKIYAKSLLFQDGNSGTSLIDVTPAAMSPQTDKAAPGSAGQDCSDVFLYVSSITESNPGQTRFILKGATGQQGGPPQQGVKGDTLPELGHEPQVGGIVRSWNQIDKVGTGSLPPRWGVDYGASVGVVWLKRGERMEFGTENKWPGNGSPGNPGGLPGVGGRGGTLHSMTVLPATMAVTSGGLSGARQADAPGGDPGTPNPGIGIWIENLTTCLHVGGGHEEGGSTCVTHAKYHFSSHASLPGPVTHSPDNPTTEGSNGLFSPELRGWLSPFAMRSILNFAEDEYRIGSLYAAREELASLVSAVANGNDRTNDPSAYDTSIQRANALLVRLSSNLDYFGNPAGWVPVLDFPTLLINLQAEIKSSAPLLISTVQISQLSQQGLAKVAQLQASRDATIDQIKQMQKQLDDFSALVPNLQQQMTDIAKEQANLQKAMQDRDQQLQQQAQDMTRSSFLSQAFKVLGAAAKVFPIGQPILAAAVSPALNFLSSVDEHTSWDQIGQLPSIVDGFSKANISQSIQNYHKVLADVNSLDTSHPKQLFSELSSAAGAVGQSVSQFQKLQDASRAPASEVDAILQQLKAEDSSLNEWTDQVNSLNSKKQDLSQSLDHAINELGDLGSEISTQTQNLDNLDSALVDQQSLVDHPGVLAAQNISRLMRERLDYYHYLVMKAFEYYSAQPYQGNRLAAGTADQLADYLRKSNGDPASAATAYQAAYVSDIKDLGRQIIQTLVNEGPGVQKDLTLVLNPHELATVNRMLAPSPGVPDLLIDLEDRGIFPNTDLEARLVKVEILKCDCAVTGEAPASAHIEIAVRSAAEGILRTSSQNLMFRETTDSQPWGASIDLTTNPAGITAFKPPADVGEVLATLLNVAPPQSYLTAPPVYPGVFLRARFFTDANTVTATIKSLQLRLTYSSRPAVGRAIRVVTQAQGEEEPFYSVGVADARQLQHGFGSFSRFYTTTAPVEIIASPSFSDQKFEGWYLRGKRVQTSPHLIIPNSNDSYLYEAHYQKQ